MKKILLLSLFSFIFINASFSQNGLSKSIKEQYDNLSYMKIIIILLEEVNEGNRSPDVLESLANSYYFNSKMEDAAKWYDELMTLNVEDLDTENYFRYSQALKGIGNYEKADEVLKEFALLEPEDSRGKLFNEDYLAIIEEESSDFEMKNLEINTSLSDFGTSVYQNNLVFASSRDKGKKVYNWNGQPFLDIYQLNSDGTVSKIKGDINTKYHESSTAFTKDGKTIYFTRNNFYKGKFKKNSKNTHGLKIYKAELVGDKWTNVVPLPFNDDEYSVSHPALNFDETKLYFSSDMPGTLGSSDLFVVDINTDGSYGEPINLGPKINTEGRENFPFVSDKGTLYFSSDGHPGLGGLDIFSFKRIDNIANSNNKPINIGKPINSKQDDFEYMINDETLEGYISSNRKNGNGDDDIYSFKRSPYMQLITGTIFDKNTNEIIDGADIVIYNNENEVVEVLKSDTDGKFSIKLPSVKSEFKSKGYKENYNELTKDFVIDPDSDDEIVLELNLEPMPNLVDLFKTLNMRPIYFDFDKSYIRPDAEIELAKIIDYMKKYPETKVDVRSHTDSRGNDTYNLILSNKRNKETIQYIINKGGINAVRLTGKGYGETQLVNKCSNGAKCTKEEHQANRRSEFILVTDDSNQKK